MPQPMDSELRYGNLLEVSSSTLRERYNRALEILTKRRSKLPRFRIDLTGFSPEVAEELGDPLYLNPRGCNRQFILLTLEQVRLPAIGTSFSTTESIVRRFIEDNREALFALTTRDAVYGELENSTYRIATLEDLLSIRQIHVEVNTTRRLISKAETLAERIRAFEDSETAWYDESFLNELIELAEAAGDIRRHPVVPTKVDYSLGNFYSSHFGGLYAFLDSSVPTVIFSDPTQVVTAEAEAAKRRYINLSDVTTLARFLEDEGLVEHLSLARAPGALELLKQRADFAVIDHVAAADPRAEFRDPEREDMKRLVHRHLDDLPEVFHRLTETARALEQGGPLPSLRPDDPGYFYQLRAADTEDRDLVNRLLAELTPLDIRQLYIWHRELFCKAYEAWPESKQAYVSDFLTRHRLTHLEAAGEARHGSVGAAPPAGSEAEQRQRSRLPESGSGRLRPEERADRAIDADFFAEGPD